MKKKWRLFLIMVFSVWNHQNLSAEEDKNIPFIDVSSFLNRYYKAEVQGISVSFAAKTLPEWMLLNIRREFSEFPPFSAEELEHYFLSISPAERTLVHFRIRNGQLYVRTNDIGYPPPMVEYTIALYKILQQPGCALGNGDFLMSVSDGVGKSVSKYPIWCFSKHRDSNFISIPDVFAIWKERLQVLDEVDNATKRTPWRSKVDKAFWIGCANGGMLENNNTWRDNQRAKLVLFSLEHPEILWARFTHIAGESHICSEMRSLDDVLCSDRISPSKAHQYKYLIDVDGVSSAFHRCQWVLRSNCVPIKEDSGNVQWYYSGLMPNIHYVPYQTDCCDLEKMIQWLRTHDDEAKKIAENGREFSIQYLNTDITYLYLYHVMLEMVNKTILEGV